MIIALRLACVVAIQITSTPMPWVSPNWRLMTMAVLRWMPRSGYPGLWEMRVIFAQTLARELFGFDGSSAVLVHGYVKRAGTPASTSDLNRAASYWKEYLRTYRVSPEVLPTADGDGTA